jgi:hypothetical protein
VGRPGFNEGAEVVSAVNKCEVRERLRKISELTVFFGIVLFGQEADIIAQRQQVLEEGARFVHAALQGVVVNHPKTTGEKGSLVPDETVH